jgi:hypothetical protein
VARNGVACRGYARKFGRDGCKPRAGLHTRRPESREGRYRRLLFRCRVQVRCLTRCGAGPRLQSEQRTVCSRTRQDYRHRHVVFRFDHSDQKSGRLMPQTLAANLSGVALVTIHAIAVSDSNLAAQFRWFARLGCTVLHQCIRSRVGASAEPVHPSSHFEGKSKPSALRRCLLRPSFAIILSFVVGFADMIS